MATNLRCGPMNYVPNEFRKLSYEEIEANHVYFVTRKFPRVACSHGHRCAVCKTVMPRGKLGGKVNMAETIQAAQANPDRVKKILSVGHKERPKLPPSTLRGLKEIQRAPVVVDNLLQGKLKGVWETCKKQYHEELDEIFSCQMEKSAVKNATLRVKQKERAAEQGLTFRIKQLNQTNA